MIAFAYTIALCIVAVVASPDDDGKWRPEKYGDSGRYNRPLNEGKYIHIPNPYLHIDNPYNGGFGPYDHVPQDYEPYVGEASQQKVSIVTPPPEYYKPGSYHNNGTKILDQNHNYRQNGYDFNFENDNKIRANERAVLKNPNSIDEGIQSEGFYEYIGTDGFLYRVEYTAGVEGFRPKVRRMKTPYSGKWVKKDT